MTPTSHSPVARYPRLRFAGALLLIFAAVLAVAAPVRAQTVGGCTVHIDGRSLADANSPERAIPVQADAVARVVGHSPEPVTRTSVSISVWPASWIVADDPLAPTTDWAGPLRIADYSRLGSGLYQVTAATEICQVQGWVNVTGRSPFETPAGLISLGVTVVGVLMALRALLTAGRGNGLLAIAGGVVTGIGLLLLAQQAGVTGITPTSAVVWTAVPGAISGVLNQVVGSLTKEAPTVVLSTGGTSVRMDGTGRQSIPPAYAPPTSARPPSPPPAYAPPTSAPPPPPSYAPHVPEAASAPAVAPIEPVPTSSVAPPPWPQPESVPPASAPPPPPPPPTSAPPAWGPTAESFPEAAPAASSSVGTRPEASEAYQETAGLGAAPTAEPDPPRTTYARLSCPDAVVAEQPFDLVVGLAEHPDARVVGQALYRPPSSVGAYTMTIQLVADGLRLAGGDASWRIDLPVTADAPYPFVTIQLIPDAQDVAVRSTSIRAMYSIDGNPIGLAVRSVALVRSADLMKAAPPPAPAPGVDLSLPAGQVAPDLTVRIERAESQASGRLLLQLLAADPSIDTPDAPILIDIGGDPAADLQRIVHEMHEVEGRPTQFLALRGIGLTIAEQLPIEFWDVLSRIAARVAPRPPSILFLSAEPYVPWELAVVDPPLDPDLPEFLAAQATVGRWVLGQRRPVLPPPMTVSVKGVAAVSGVYELPGWQRLADAEAEAADIVRVYGASAVDATIGGILDLLKGHPAADVIHFAVHGSYDALEARDGLILVDGTALDPLAVKGIALRGHPFVFLNACQVGRGSQVLGDHAGLAAAFLFAGAAGVIAPLWSVDDGLAREIAIRFYERAMAGEAPAEIMRTERAAFRDSPETTSSTYLAYQFFGHPGLRLVPAAG